MGRPPLGLGTNGAIRVYQVGKHRHRAETLYRDWDGETRPVKRVGKTKREAEQNLKVALRDRQRVTGSDLSREHTFAEAGERWLAEVKRKRPGTTYDRYRTRLRNKVIPAIGQLRLRECSVGAMDRYIEALQLSGLAPDTVRGYRNVLSGVIGYAVRMDAIPVNTVRAVAPIEGKGKESRGLTHAERVDLLAKVDADERAVADDLPSVLRYLIGCGVRIGEAMGLRWFRVDFDEGVAIHGDNLVRETGQGLVLHSPKTEAGFRVLPLPDFVLMMLRMRYPGEGFDLSPVFPNAIGGWRDPNNTGRSIRKFRKAAGYEWFTSHVCRHTAITICDQEGLTPREISGYHGHARPSFTQDRYMDRRQQSGAVPRAIDAAMRPARH